MKFSLDDVRALALGLENSKQFIQTICDKQDEYRALLLHCIHDNDSFALLCKVVTSFSGFIEARNSYQIELREALGYIERGITIGNELTIMIGYLRTPSRLLILRTEIAKALEQRPDDVHESWKMPS